MYSTEGNHEIGKAQSLFIRIHEGSQVFNYRVPGRQQSIAITQVQSH